MATGKTGMAVASPSLQAELLHSPSPPSHFKTPAANWCSSMVAYFPLMHWATHEESIPVSSATSHE